MVKIVHLEFKRRRPERFLVTTDGGESFLFSPDIALKYGIAPQKEFSEEEFQTILQENSIQCAKDQALRYLELRPHSQRELRDKLLQKGYSPTAIEAALEDLKRVDLVNDETFARLYIQNELTLRPVGRLLLKNKLLQRGISAEAAQQLLDELYSPEEERKNIRLTTEKFLKTNQRLKKSKLREKLVRHLMNKGFVWEDIRQVLMEENLLRPHQLNEG